MVKWADFLISEVRFGKGNKIEEIKQHIDDGQAISEGTMVQRADIFHNIKNGKTYKTIFHSLKGWKLGDDLRAFKVRGIHYIRTDKNKVDQDFLGPIPQF